ncbi:hypothetical protein [Lacticaseibacillus kribbianus]|uniref:hypothetical protein n=1 Tax=Lacticaseibacillus kribbianus TaxID=2926292 RepID=UPI001CD71C1D|nr:hypothetical protein [Lacticaseibacillus kribbianus]
MGDLLGMLLEFLLEPVIEYLFAPSYAPNRPRRNRVRFGIAGVVNLVGVGFSGWLLFATLRGRLEWGLVLVALLLLALFVGLLVRLAVTLVRGRRAAAKAKPQRPAADGYREDHL